MSAETSAATTRAQTNKPNTDLKKWHYVLLSLGAIAAIAGSILVGPAYAFGAATGAVLMYTLAIKLALHTYTKYEVLQLQIIPQRIYIGICLFSGLVSIPSAFALQSHGNGAFVFFYITLFGIALAVFAIKKKS